MTGKPRGLWLAREMPFPLDSGDRIYTALLAKSLAEAGVDLTFTGFFPSSNPALPDWPIHWHCVEGSRRRTWRSLLSLMPLVTAAHATSVYVDRVKSLLEQKWDFIVVDQYGMGWALPLIRNLGNETSVVYVSHDHETSVSQLLYTKYNGSIFKKIAFWQNHVKTRWMEERIVRSVDLLTMISNTDAHHFHAIDSEARTIVLTPGYSGVSTPRRMITSTTPRHVLMVGSYHWIAKQENLRRFALAADAAFCASGIELHVIGSMPEALAQELRGQCKAIRIHGFVESLAEHMVNARIAVVPEEIGGGFKLKFLDFIFNRIPVATLTYASEGLPQDIVDSMICAESIAGLIESIVNAIDDIPVLEHHQNTAYEKAQDRFTWSTRGALMLQSVLDVRGVAFDATSMTTAHAAP